MNAIEQAAKHAPFFAAKMAEAADSQCQQHFADLDSLVASVFHGDQKAFCTALTGDRGQRVASVIECLAWGAKRGNAEKFQRLFGLVWSDVWGSWGCAVANSSPSTW